MSTTSQQIRSAPSQAPDAAREWERSEALDRAFEQVSSLDFPPGHPFVSHAPMACEALTALGRPDRLDDWVRAFEGSLVEVAQPAAPTWRGDHGWRDRLGDRRLLPEWLGYFDRSMGEEGWSHVVRVWVPRLMPGLTAALFHGVIRTSHATRAIEAVDTPMRRRELARALANWVTWYSPGRDHHPLPDPEVDPDDGEDLAVEATRAAAGAARAYVDDPNIVYLHGVTGAMAVALLTHHLAPVEGATAVRQLQSDHQHLYGRSLEAYRGIDRRPTRRTAAAARMPWSDAAADRATDSFDPHQLKLVEACRRGWTATGDAAFADAARGGHRHGRLNEPERAWRCR